MLFADLVGFTPLSESRDPEEVRELLSEYFERTRTIILRYGGVVEKFIGDAVMAVWGTPVATEGDAERAVRAALEVLAMVTEVGDEVGAPGLAARAGVVTGEVAVTRGSGNEGVAGDSVNTAARVQSVANPGEVWVDSATQRLASAAIGFTDAGEHVLKGKSEPLRLWAATRVVSGVGGSQRVDGIEAPLMGREAELRTIKELFHATAERRVPRLVVISGPAGVGKSRLGWEFEKYVDGLVDEVYWHRGRCLSYGDGVAFSALSELVRQRFSIAEDDPVNVAAEKLQRHLEELVPDAQERAYVGPRLARLLGVTFGSDASQVLGREELFAGWRLFFERLAEQRPVVILVEDAQYADQGLLDFVDHLVDWARSSRVYILVFGRTELDERRSGLGTGRNRSRLNLDPLDRASMNELIDTLVPGMPEAARSAISAQAEGIPLFAVETIRTLVDHGVVGVRDGAYRLEGDLGVLSVPEGLRGLLAARLDSLDPVLRSLVSEASVLGSSFGAESLVAVSEQEQSSVRSGLVELLRREVLTVTTDRLSPQVGDYQFSQDMLRQVAYETIPRRDRKARHLAVAAHLRETFASDGDEYSEVISQHYLDALNAVPEAQDAPDIRAQAIGMLVRAAERALRAGAPRSAFSNFAKAAEQTELGAAGDDGSISLGAASLLENAAMAARTAFDVERTREFVERARGLYEAHGDVRSAARLQVTLADVLRATGRLTEALELVESALSVLRPQPDSDTVRALYVLATIQTFSGDSDVDRTSADALELGQALEVDVGLLCDLFIGRGLAVGWINRRHEAIAHLEYAASLAQKIPDLSRESRALLNLGEMIVRSDPTTAAEVAKRSFNLAVRAGDVRLVEISSVNIGEALLLTGDWDGALSALKDAIDRQGPDHALFCRVLRVQLCALRGDVETAEDLSYLDPMRTIDDPQQRAIFGVSDAFLLAAAGHNAEALKRVREVFSYAPALGIGFNPFQWAWPLGAQLALDAR
ncbi:MAG: adenylate/guanylate cyclase domain-containing protein, partial [Acidimicrobiales bacterium]